MSCEAYSERRILAAYGELGADAEWEAHVAVCPACASEVEETREVRRLWSAGAPASLPEAARRRILGSLRPRRSAGWRPALAAVLMIGFVMGPIVLLRSGPKPVVPGPSASAEKITPGTAVDRGIEDVRGRVLKLTPSRPPSAPPAWTDRELKEMRQRVDRMKWNSKDW